ncbi:MAG: protein kinase domain-containing protein [Gemmatimonadales bacterium]
MTDIPCALADALRDRYVLDGELGRGGMATVYLAQDLKHGRRVALKVLRPEVGPAFGAARFLREIHVTAGLQHPHILPVFDSGEAAGQLWYTMPYVAGESLRERLRREARLRGGVVLQIGREVAEALDYAHSQGIVHRDIKPENILLSRGHALVADFGIARALGPSGGGETGERLTETGLVIGSWGYMSPEQRFAAPVGSASDIFSLGVVLYEALTGDHPFKTLSPLEALQPALGRTLAAPSRLAPELPEALDALIFRMLSPDPERRPGAGEVAQALAARPGEHERIAPAGLRPARRRHSVGRADERRQLRDAFEALDAEGGRLLCITGEPGIGKTTLVEDFLAELSEEAEPPRIARGHCSERLAGSEAYLPLLEALQGLLQGTLGNGVARSVALLAPSWHAQVVPPTESSSARARAETTAGSQERMKRELGNLLQELSRLRPLVFFLDDIHWADLSTVDLLAYLAMRFESTRLLTLVTYRPTELLLGRHPFLPIKLDLQARGLCREIALGFLTPADVAGYVDLEFPGHQFAPSFPDFIHGRTEGSPLFMVDLLRYLRDRGVIQRAHEGWGLGQSVPELERELPESVRGMIEKKIAQLTDAERQLLVMASVQGYRFDSATLASALALAPAEVEEELQALERVHGFVRLIGERELPDGTLTLRYQFVHVLYQNALYAALAPTRRAQSSAAVAQALLTFYGEQGSTVAAELALLFEAARDLSRAAEYFLLAAQNATRVFAYREAVALAQRGLALVEKLPVTPERARRESMLCITLGSLLIATKGGGDPEVEAAYQRARELSEVGAKAFNSSRRCAAYRSSTTPAGPGRPDCPTPSRPWPWPSGSETRRSWWTLTMRWRCP